MKPIVQDLDYFQDHMPENVCFGCGAQHDEGLQIKSFWEGNTAICRWVPAEKYHGWSNLLNGGIMATLIDCHCMGTAMADAYRRENRSLDSTPIYRYATGTLNVKYIKPTSTRHEVELHAEIVEVKERKTVLKCAFYSQGKLTAEAEVVGLRVYDSSNESDNNPFKS
ncbi:MAG: PaaI family thioesterase [Cyclobacteriaceae bacterium]